VIGAPRRRLVRRGGGRAVPVALDRSLRPPAHQRARTLRLGRGGRRSSSRLLKRVGDLVGEQVAPGVRLWLIPPAREVDVRTLREGLRLQALGGFRRARIRVQADVAQVLAEARLEVAAKRIGQSRAGASLRVNAALDLGRDVRNLLGRRGPLVSLLVLPAFGSGGALDLVLLLLRSRPFVFLLVLLLVRGAIDQLVVMLFLFLLVLVRGPLDFLVFLLFFLVFGLFVLGRGALDLVVLF